MRIAQLPDVVARLKPLSIDSVGNSSEEFSRIIAADIERWRRSPAPAISRWPSRTVHRMTDPVETQVLVVGGGPVGLTLAMDLASRGESGTVVAELRHKGEPPSVKCNHVSARSMEIFRRLGVAQGGPRRPACPPTTPTTFPIASASPARSCRASRFRADATAIRPADGPDTWWPTAEPPHRINQIYLEPMLFAHAETIAGLTLLNRVEINSFEQTPTA